LVTFSGETEKVTRSPAGEWNRFVACGELQRKNWKQNGFRLSPE
jgi:hypothetical protein